MFYGYLRVSTENQTIKNQKLKILTRFKINLWVEDLGTGGKTQKNLQDLIENRLVEGDTLVVTALDRLGRNVRNCAEIAETLSMKGVILISMREGVDFSTSSGKLAFNIMASMAEFERAAISERVKDGLARAKAEGKKLGVPKKHTFSKELEIAQSLKYLKHKYNFGFKKSKPLLESIFKGKLSIGYLSGLSTKFKEDLTGLPYPKEEIDSGVVLIKERKGDRIPKKAL